MMDSLRSVIVTDIYSFQLDDLSESESRVMPSWVPRVAILFNCLSWIVDYFGINEPWLSSYRIVASS